MRLKVVASTKQILSLNKLIPSTSKSSLTIDRFCI